MASKTFRKSTKVAKKVAVKRVAAKAAARPRTRADKADGKSSASQLISARIAELGDWRGDMLRRARKLIKEADPGITEKK